MKFREGPWAIVAGALASAALVGCDAPIERENPSPGTRTDKLGESARPPGAITPATEPPQTPKTDDGPALEGPKESAVTTPSEKTPVPKIAPNPTESSPPPKVEKPE